LTPGAHLIPRAPRQCRPGTRTGFSAEPQCRSAPRHELRNLLPAFQDDSRTRIVVLPRAFHDALRVVEDPLSASRIRSISLRLREFCAPDEGGFSAQGTAISLVSFPQVLMEPELAIVVIETGKVRRILPEPALGQSVSRSWTCCCGIAQFTSVAVFLAMH